MLVGTDDKLFSALTQDSANPILENESCAVLYYQCTTSLWRFAMKKLIAFLGLFVLLATTSQSNTLFTEDFLDEKLSNDWSFRDLRSGSSAWMVKDWEQVVDVDGRREYGALHITNYEAFGHTQRDRPVLETKIPEQAGDNFSVEGIFGYYTVGDVFMGLFLFGDNDSEFAYICFGGEKVSIELYGLIVVSGGSEMQWVKPKKGAGGVYADFRDNGPNNTGFEHGYIELKIVKRGNSFRGYYRSIPDEFVSFITPNGWLPVNFVLDSDERKPWKETHQSFNTPWEYDFEVKRIGVGFLNNWSGWRTTLRVHFLTLTSEEEVPNAPATFRKSTTRWASLKELR